MKCIIKITDLELSNRFQFWFGPDVSLNDWELTLMILSDELQYNNIRIPRNKLEKKYRQICSRLKK